MQKKQGISLIVLVIAIIVMIILASSVVITLSNTGVINKASQAVDLTNESAVQDLAALIWADAYMDDLRGVDLVEEVETKLEAQGITEAKWNISISDTGIVVKNKSTTATSTLGSLLTVLDYGKTVNYVSDNGVTDWKIFYHTDNYVYLITSEAIPANKIPENFISATGASITDYTATVLKDSETTSVEYGMILWPGCYDGGTNATIQHPSMWLVENEKVNMLSSYLLSETYWQSFKNTTAKYAEYVEGATGTPSYKMLEASWNAKDIAKHGTLTNPLQTYGIPTDDELYFWSSNYGSYWLAGGQDYYSLGNGLDWSGSISSASMSDGCCEWGDYGLRPVVCLNANISASVDSNGNFVI